MKSPYFKPLRAYTGAAFLCALGLFGCAPVAPYHTLPQAPAGGILKHDVKQMQVIEVKGLRVLLRRGAKNLHLSASSGLRLLDPNNGSVLIEFGTGQKGQLSAEQGRLRAGGRLLDSSKAELRAFDGHDSVRVMGIQYRGKLLLEASGDNLLLVNEVALDDYLYGVLPSEVSENWPIESLKAQAVAARTYAVFRAGSSESPLYDLDDSTRSQVYLGMSKEGQHCRDAVDATSAMVLAYGGQLAQTFFHANCGGHTADARSVWGTDVPYLRGVGDPFCEQGAHYSWHGSMDQDAILSALRKAGHPINDFENIELKGRDDGDRWKTVNLTGRGASLSLSANLFRIALGGDKLRSTNFEWSRHGDTNEFSGHGWGHGVGLCQEGAEGMARQGYRFKDILYFYFPGTKIKKLVE